MTKQKAMLITAKWLQEQGACTQEVARFKKLWPRGLRLTRDNLVKVAIANLDVSWLVWHMPGVTDQQKRDFGFASGAASDVEYNLYEKGMRISKLAMKKVQKAVRMTEAWAVANALGVD